MDAFLWPFRSDMAISWPLAKTRRHEENKRQIVGKNLPTGFMCDSTCRFAWHPPGKAHPRTRLDTPSTHRKHDCTLYRFAPSRLRVNSDAISKTAYGAHTSEPNQMDAFLWPFRSDMAISWPRAKARRHEENKRQIAGKNMPTGFMCDSIYRFAWQPPGNAQPRTRLDTPSAHRKNRLHFVPLRAFAASREQRRDQLDGIRCS